VFPYFFVGDRRTRTFGHLCSEWSVLKSRDAFGPPGKREKRRAASLCRGGVVDRRQDSNFLRDRGELAEPSLVSGYIHDIARRPRFVLVLEARASTPPVWVLAFQKPRRRLPTSQKEA
jgi:hypothetical protein